MSTQANSKTFSEKLGRDGLIMIILFIVLASILVVVTIVLLIRICKSRCRTNNAKEEPGVEEAAPVEKRLSPGRTYLVEEQDRRSKMSNLLTDYTSFYSDSHVQMTDLPNTAENMPDNNIFRECPSEKGKQLSNRISILSSPSFTENAEQTTELSSGTPGSTQAEQMTELSSGTPGSIIGTTELSSGTPGSMQSDGSMLI